MEQAVSLPESSGTCWTRWSSSCLAVSYQCEARWQHWSCGTITTGKASISFWPCGQRAQEPCTSKHEMLKVMLKGQTDGHTEWCSTNWKTDSQTYISRQKDTDMQKVSQAKGRTHRLTQTDNHGQASWQKDRHTDTADKCDECHLLWHFLDIRLAQENHSFPQRKQ